MKDKIKKAFNDWIVRAVYLGIVLINIYLVALIIPDTITPIVAENIGYLLLAIVIILVLIGGFFISLANVEKRDLLIRQEVDARIITNLEKELTTLKRR